jgi:hypothetical protein
MLVPNYMQTWGLARAFGATVREWRFIEDLAAGRWRVDLPALEALVNAKTRMIVICNPNNPTGARLTAADLDGVARIADRHGAWILSDEVYRGAELDGQETASMWGRSDRAIITSGLSKAYGLPGLRIGWIVAPPPLVAGFWSYHDYVTIAPGALSDRLARVALAPARRARLLDRTRAILRGNLPLIEDWAARRRRVPPDRPGGRGDRLRALPASDQFDHAGHAPARREERVDRARRSLRHGRLPAAGFRRTARLQPCRPGAAARAARLPARPGHAARRVAPMSQLELPLVLIGFGNVARRFLRLLDETADRLDFTWKVVGISTRHHGSAIDIDGIDVARALAYVESNQSLDRLDPAPRERSGIDVIRQVADLMADEAAEGRLVCVETTVLDIDRGEPAVSHVRAALEGQAHVVTANKGPAAFAYHELEALAESVDRIFFFEGAVMDGVPVFNLVRETCRRSHRRLRGVINST